jgi:hypothetical protein
MLQSLHNQCAKEVVSKQYGGNKNKLLMLKYPYFSLSLTRVYQMQILFEVKLQLRIIINWLG